MLADPTTGLSESLEKASVDAMFYGSSIVKLSNGGTGSGPMLTAIGKGTVNPVIKQLYSPPVRLRKTDLEEHPAFELTVEQLRAAWIITYGTRWVSMEEPMNDDYLNVVTHRLISFGELETHQIIDQNTPMGRIKIQDASS
jgi:hypothetical protein